MKSPNSVYAGNNIKVLMLEQPTTPGEIDRIRVTRDMELATGIVEDGESLDSAAYRIARNVYGAQYPTTAARIAPIDGYQSLVIEESTDANVNPQKYLGTQAIRIDHFIKLSEEYPDELNAHDAAIARAQYDRTYRL